MTRAATGLVGEYAVAAELSRRGWLVTMAIGHAPEIDLMAAHPEAWQHIDVQVKTASPNRGHFQLSPLHEDAPGSLWFVFVKLRGELERPQFFVVPGGLVAAILYAVRKRLEVEAGKRTSVHRVMHPSWIVGYEDGWELLHADPQKLERGSHAFAPDEQIIAAIRKYGRPRDKSAIPRRVRRRSE